MEAEVVRDSVLAAAGQLDPTAGGQELPQEQGLTTHRRSLYYAHHGDSRMQFLELFDEADPIECYRRTTSVLPQQALALANSDFCARMGRLLARRLAAGAADDEAFVRAAFEQVLSRAPTPAERAAARAFLARAAGTFRAAGLRPAPPDPAGKVPATDPAARARENLVQALLNHNDFVTIR
jgi:hypothetical protein